MRITSGIYKGRVLKRVNTPLTRETSDKVKQAMFNMLFDVSNKVVLDVFSGSGQLAFEALSRGASHAIVVDDQKEAISTILDNAMMLGCQKQLTIIEEKITLKNPLKLEQQTDIIIMDPPYDYTSYQSLLFQLPEAKEVMIECAKHIDLPNSIGPYEVKKEKTYGKKKLFYFRNHEATLD